MSASFFRPRPTLRDMLSASASLPPDQIDLYGVFSDAGNELLRAGADAMRARQWHERVPDDVLRAMEAACNRALRAIANYRG